MIFGKAKEVSPRLLADRVQRACARFARIARHNAVNGGASALTKLDRLERMGSPNVGEYNDAITQAYHSSTGTATDYLAYECSECGCAHMGIDAAIECCSPDDDCEE